VEKQGHQDRLKKAQEDITRAKELMEISQENIVLYISEIDDAIKQHELWRKEAQDTADKHEAHMQA